MNELQKVQYELLLEFIRVCEENNLRYYLMGGTALGAVRHKGFIPWDDDIDVAMPRPDYDKFMKMQDKLPEYYFIQNFKTDPHYIYNFAKIRDNRTTYIENFYKNHRINHGVWIDIFPLDGVSNKMCNPKKFKAKMLYMWWNVWAMYLPALLRKPKKGTIVKDICLDIVGALFYFLNPFHLRNKWVEFLITHHKYDESVMIANYLGNIPGKAAMPRSFYGNGTKLPFEGIEAMGPEDCDGYLTWVYGNYMKFPPIEKQVGHHYNKGFSLSQGYASYMREHKI